MDVPVIDIGTGAEQIARSAALQIATNLDAQCSVQEGLWNQRDLDWAMAMGIQYFPTEITRVPKQRVFTGRKPSLVESRFDLWPAIAVYTDLRRPSMNNEQPDQYDSMDIKLVIEVLAMVGPLAEDPFQGRDAEDAIDRQYQRLSDAVEACVAIDKSLGGTILPIKLPPTMTPSLPFLRKLDKGAGADCIFQGMEIVYFVTKMLY